MANDSVTGEAISNSVTFSPFDIDESSTQWVTEEPDMLNDITTTDTAQLRLELCSRLSPPPIPPWLLETPERVRHLVTNCSSWKKYSDMCSLQMLPEYTLALAEPPEPGASVVQWIPFMIVVVLGLCIVISASVTYSLYKSKRIKFDFFTEYHKCSKGSKDFAHLYGCISPSLTVESQLSFCSLEEDSYAAIVPSHVVYSELSSSRSHIQPQGSSDSVYHSLPDESALPEEVILSAHLLTEDHRSPSFVSDLSCKDYYSSHSLPIDSESESSETKPQYVRSKCTANKSVTDFSDLESPYVQIRKGYQPTSMSWRNGSYVHAGSKRDINRRRVGNVQKLVERCRKAGASLIHGVIWNRVPIQDNFSAQHTKMSSFHKLRQPFYNFDERQTGTCHPTTAADALNENPHCGDLDILQTSATSLSCEDGKSLLKCQGNVPLTHGKNFQEVNHTSKHLGNFLQFKKAINKKRSLVKDENERQRSVFVNEAFDSNPDGESRPNRLSKKIKVPQVFRKLSKKKESQ